MAYQSQFAAGAVLEVRKFAPHISVEDKVLDFGCCGGWILSKLNCADRLGVELNEAAHTYCCENGVAVVRTLDEVDEKKFDVAISNHCLEHVPCPVEALRGIFDHLRPGGGLILALPLDDWRVQRDYSGEDIDHHLHTWSPRLLANTLVEAGFKVDRVEIITHAWFPGWQRALNMLPSFAFNALCWVTAVLKKRRQLLAIAHKPS